MKQKPTISVILPVCNNAKHLKDCLTSIFASDLKPFEVIAIDDNSSDNSCKILQKFKKGHAEKNLRIYKNIKRYGISVTLNRAVKKASGKFITFMNPNDIFSKFRLRKQMQFLSKNPDFTAVGAQCRYINSNGKYFSKSLFPENHEEICQTLLPGLSLNPNSVMINRKLLPNDIFKFDTNSYPFVFSNIFIKFANFGKIKNLKDYLYFQRKENIDLDVLDKARNIINLLKVWVKTMTIYDFRPSFRAFFLSFSYFL